MRRFPRREAQIAKLAGQIVAGLEENPDDFPSPPVAPDELRKTLDSYVDAYNETVQARAAVAMAVKVKDEALQNLILGIKSDLRYAELAVKYNNTKLAALGWRKRKEPSPMQPPGPARTLVVKREGPGWASLDWKKPKEGGPVAYYQLRVRRVGRGEWRDDARCFETAVVAENQERGVELEYCVVALNKAGQGVESNSVTVLL